MATNALILDFDGTIIDTETPAFESTETIWARHGIEFPMDWWLQGMGTDRKSTWVKELESRLGRAIDHDQIMDERQRIKNKMTLSQPVLPGIVKLLDAAECRNIEMAVGSSSPHSWVDQHLKQDHIANHVFNHWTRLSLAPSVADILCCSLAYVPIFHRRRHSRNNFMRLAYLCCV